MRECCKEVLSWIEYKEEPYNLKGHLVKVILKSSDLYYCCLCGKVLGTCPFCGKSYGFPFLIFINEGKEGMLALCKKCLNSLNLFKVK
jgi:hypothetical protein